MLSASKAWQILCACWCRCVLPRAASLCAQASRGLGAAPQSSAARLVLSLLIACPCALNLTCEACGRLCSAPPVHHCARAPCCSSSPARCGHPLHSLASSSSHLQGRRLTCKQLEGRGQVRCARSAAPSFALRVSRACWIHLPLPCLPVPPDAPRPFCAQSRRPGLGAGAARRSSAALT